MKKLLPVLLLISSLSYSFPADVAEKGDNANRALLEKNYEEAARYYAEFLEAATAAKHEHPYEQLAIRDAKVFQQYAQLLSKIKQTIPLFIEARSYEAARNFRKVQQIYTEILKILRKNNLSSVIFFNEILNGSVEEMLAEKLKALKTFNYGAIDKIKEDIRRQKTITFFQIVKDKKIEYDIDPLIVQNLTAVIENKNSFRILGKNMSIAQRHELSQQRKVNFIVMGEARKDPKKDRVLLKLYIIEPALERRIVELSETLPLDYDFFKKIESIATQMEARLEEIAKNEIITALNYFRERPKTIDTDEKALQNTSNLLGYVENRILSSEVAYIKANFELNRILNEKKDFYSKMNLLYLLPEFESGLNLNAAQQENRRFLENSTTLPPQIFNLYLQKTVKDYESYLDGYDGTSADLELLKNSYPAQISLFEGIEKSLELNKAEVEISIEAMFDKISYRHGPKLMLPGIYNKALGRLGQTNTLQNDLNVNNYFSFSLGYGFDLKLFSFLWASAETGFGNRYYNLEKIGIFSRTNVGTFFYINAGLKFQFLDHVSFNTLLRFEGYFHLDPAIRSPIEGKPIYNKELARESGAAVMEPNGYAGLGFEYTTYLFRNIDLGIALTYFSAINDQSLNFYGSPVQNELKQDDYRHYYKNDIIQLAATLYFNSYEYRSRFDVLQPQKHVLPYLDFYDEVGKEFLAYRSLNTGKPLNLDDFIKIENARNTVINRTKLKDMLVNLYFLKQNEKYEEYLELFAETQTVLKDTRTRYQGLTFVVEEIESHIAENKAEVDEILKKIGTRVKYRHGIRLEAGSYLLSPFNGKDRLNDNDFQTDRSTAFKAGYVFDHRFFSDFWATAGAGFGQNKFRLKQLLNGNVILGSDNYIEMIYFDLGMKYNPVSELYLCSALRFEGYFDLSFNNPDNKLMKKELTATGDARINAPGLYWGLGVEYFFPFISDMSLSLSLNYYKVMLDTKYQVFNTARNKDEHVILNDQLSFSATAWFNSYTPKTVFPEYTRKGFWFSVIASLHHEYVFFYNDRKSEIRLKSTLSPGFGFSYRPYNQVCFNLEHYFLNSSNDDDDGNLALKGFTDLVSIEADLITIKERFSFFYGAGFSFTAIYQRKAYNFDRNASPMIIADISDRIKPVYFNLVPAIVGLKFQVFYDLAVKLYFTKGMNMFDFDPWLVGFKLEYKL